MSIQEDTNKVTGNIRKIYGQRAVKLFALSLSYAGQAINIFRQEQSEQTFWKNQTGQASSRMFSNAFIEGSTVGWFLSHGVEYGVYLELANDRQNEAIRPIIRALAPKFFKDAEGLY